MAQQATLSVSLHVLARHWPSVGWEGHHGRAVWGFGWRYSLSIAIWQGRNLAVPLLVSRYAGGVGLGYVTLAQKLVDAIGFPRTVAYRLAIAVLSKLRAGGRGLAKIERAMIVQVLLVGLISTVVAATGAPLAERFLGSSWAGMMTVFRPLAIVGIVNCAFHLHCSALYVYDRADLVNWFNLANLSILLVVALWLGRAHGMEAYLAAELAALASYGLLVVLAKRSIGLDYPRAGGLWLAAAVAAVVAAGWGWTACLVLAAPALFARGRAELRTWAEMARNHRSLHLVPES
jgi:PST family polysaccharide transporter